MDINRSNLNDLFRGYNLQFNAGFAAMPSQLDTIAMTNSEAVMESTYPWLGTLPGMREWVGDRVIQNLKSYKFSIVSKPFEATFSVLREEIEFDKYGVYSPMARVVGETAKTHPDELTYGLLKNGATELCYDGQYFFDTDHPVLDANGSPVSQSNYQTGGGALWMLVDDSRTIKPMVFQKARNYQFLAMDSDTDEQVFNRRLYRYGVDSYVNAGFGLWQLAQGSRATLDDANFEAAFVAMTTRTGDYGRKLNLRPKKLVVAAGLEWKAKKLVAAVNNAAGATNVYNAAVEVVSVPYLD